MFFSFLPNSTWFSFFYSICRFYLTEFGPLFTPNRNRFFVFLQPNLDCLLLPNRIRFVLYIEPLVCCFFYRVKFVFFLFLPKHIWLIVFYRVQYLFFPNRIYIEPNSNYCFFRTDFCWLFLPKEICSFLFLPNCIRYDFFYRVKSFFAFAKPSSEPSSVIWLYQTNFGLLFFSDLFGLSFLPNRIRLVVFYRLLFGWSFLLPSQIFFCFYETVFFCIFYRVRIRFDVSEQCSFIPNLIRFVIFTEYNNLSCFYFDRTIFDLMFLPSSDFFKIFTITKSKFLTVQSYLHRAPHSVLAWQTSNSPATRNSANDAPVESNTRTPSRSNAPFSDKSPY